MPCRETEAKRLTIMLDSNSINILKSAPKTGKTSLLNTTITPENLQKRNAVAVRFDIPKFKFGEKALEKQLVAIINSMCDRPTYLDLAFEDDGSLWYAAKKLQANHKDRKNFYFIFDNFHNYFTYGEAARREFAASLSRLANGEVPTKVSEKMQEIMLGDSGVILPQDGMMLMIEPPKTSLLFVVDNYTFPLMSQLSDSIPNILRNTLELTPFDVETAQKAVPIIAAEPHESLPPVTIETPAIEYLVSHFAASGGIVNPGLLRNAVLYIRQEAKGFDNITLPMMEISEYFRLSYFDEAMEKIDDDDSRNAIAAFVKGEMTVEGESQPLPAYRGVATSKYGIGESDLLTMETHYIFKSKIADDGRIYYMPYNGEIFSRLKKRDTPTTPAAAQTTGPIRPAAMTASASSMRKERRMPKNKILIGSLVAMTMGMFALVLLAFSLKGNVEHSANVSKSNMLSAFSFQKLESDPTFSLRLAQQAITLDTNNTQAYSALLNSFYNTDIFYNISGKLNGRIEKAEISGGGEYVLTYLNDTASGKFAARILRENGDIFLEIPLQSEPTSITMSPDRQKILTTSYDSTARLFDLKGREILTIKGHPAIIWTADFSPDGSKIITAGSDYNIMVWDSVGNNITTLRGHDYDVYTAKFSPDGKKLLSAGGDNSARLWDLDNSECKILSIKENSKISMSLISDAVFSPDGQYILIAANDFFNINHRARLWDLDGNEIMTFDRHHDWINSVRFSPDGKHVVTSCRDKIVRVFDINGILEKELKGHGSNVWSATYKPDNQTIVTVGDDHTIRTWSIGKRFESYDKARNVSFAGFSSNGLKIMVVQDSTAQSWDLTGDVAATYEGHHANITTSRFSPDGSKVLTACKDGSAILWKSDGSRIQTFYGHSLSVNDAIFTCDGRNAVTISDDATAVVRDLESNTDTKIQFNSKATAACASPEPEVFAVGTEAGDIYITDIAGKILRTFHAHDARVNSVAFSPDGRHLVSTSSDETAVLWDILGQRQYTFRGYENKVNSAVFSPDGKYIVTTSDDGYARLWTTDGKDIMAFEHDGVVKNAVFSPDGKYLLTVFHSANGIKTLKLRILNPDGITRHIDQLDLYGTVWKPDSATMRRYGID